MESDAWLQGGKAETNLKLLVVTENRANGVYFPGSDLHVFLRVAHPPKHNRLGVRQFEALADQDFLHLEVVAAHLAEVLGHFAHRHAAFALT